MKSDDLIIFKKKSYKKVSIRISNGKFLIYYKIHLDRLTPPLDPRGHLLPHQRDSIESYKRYSTTLNGAKQGENNAHGSMFNISLDALSKQNRDRWAFQAMYEKWQNEKYVDFVFNKELVTKITSLAGDDLRRFMRYFRPTYQFLRSATEYEYLDYLKQSYKQFLTLGKY